MRLQIAYEYDIRSHQCTQLTFYLQFTHTCSGKYGVRFHILTSSRACPRARARARPAKEEAVEEIELRAIAPIMFDIESIAESQIESAIPVVDRNTVGQKIHIARESEGLV